MPFNRMSYNRRGETAEFSLLNECLAEIARRRKLAYGSAAIALGLALVLALVIPHTYTGVAEVMPSLHKSSSSSMAAMIPGAAMFSETAGQANLYLELLKSTTVKNRVLQELGCSPENPRLVVQPPAAHNKDAIEQAVSQANFSADFKSGLIKINTTIADRELSARLANEFVYQLDLRLQELEKSAAARSSGYFADLIGEQQDKLKEIEDTNAAFLARNRNYPVSTDPELQRDLERRKFDLEFNRELLLNLLGMKANSDLEARKSIPRLVVIEWAETPAPKSFFARLKTIVISTCGAALFAIGLIVFGRVYLRYIPPTTRKQLADSYGVLGQDAQVIVQRLRRPLKIRDMAGV